MLSRNDPRIRRAIDQITQNFEAANERTQENLFTFTKTYINPCFSSITECLRECNQCSLNDEERRRRHRAAGRQRGHAESSFDFYDDWEQDETDPLLGFAGDERDPLLGGGPGQPQRERGMSYGARQRGPRKTLGRLEDPEQNTNI